MTEGLCLPIISVPDIKFVAGKPGTDIRAHLAELATDLQAAMAHHQAGGLDEAEALYRKLLDAVPNHPHALHLLGALETGRGRPARAVELIGRALPALARSPEAHVARWG